MISFLLDICYTAVGGSYYNFIMNTTSVCGEQCKNVCTCIQTAHGTSLAHIILFMHVSILCKIEFKFQDKKNAH